MRGLASHRPLNIKVSSPFMLGRLGEEEQQGQAGSRDGTGRSEQRHCVAPETLPPCRSWALIRAWCRDPCLQRTQLTAGLDRFLFAVLQEAHHRRGVAAQAQGCEDTEGGHEPAGHGLPGHRGGGGGGWRREEGAPLRIVCAVPVPPRQAFFQHTTAPCMHACMHACTTAGNARSAAGPHPPRWPVVCRAM